MKNLDIFKDILICPYCGSSLKITKERVLCTNKQCKKEYPIINGIPIILNEEKSLFFINDFVKEKQTTIRFKNKKNLKNSLVKNISKMLPSISNNLSAKKNFKRIISILRKKENPKVLIIGGGIITTGTEILLKEKGVQFVESDVSFGPRTRIVLDCHNIPFSESTFDCVILQAVLEHVIDPYQCISEVTRVLKKDGLVYAATPFMQQVHMGKYDFTRFTYLGHRRLFRSFKEIESGVFAGTGVALAWSIKYFLRSLSNRKPIIISLDILTRLLFFWLKYIDYLTKDSKGTYDAASGFYFIGEKGEKPISDKKILENYRGV